MFYKSTFVQYLTKVKTLTYCASTNHYIDMTPRVIIVYHVFPSFRLHTLGPFNPHSRAQWLWHGHWLVKSQGNKQLPKQTAPDMPRPSVSHPKTIWLPYRGYRRCVKCGYFWISEDGIMQTVDTDIKQRYMSWWSSGFFDLPYENAFILFKMRFQYN